MRALIAGVVWLAAAGVVAWIVAAFFMVLWVMWPPLALAMGVFAVAVIAGLWQSGA